MKCHSQSLQVSVADEQITRERFDPVAVQLSEGSVGGK